MAPSDAHATCGVRIKFGRCSPNNGFSGTGTDTTYSTGVNYTRSWSNTLVMEARGGMNYFRNQALIEGNGLKTAQDVGIRVPSPRQRPLHVREL